MFWLGMIIGAVCGFLLMCVFVAGEDNADARQLYKNGAREFAERLKARAGNQDAPWEDNYIYESDVDKLLKEMESEY